MIGFLGVKHNRNTVVIFYHFGIADPIRSGNNHLVAGIENSPESIDKRMLCSVADDNLRRLIVKVIVSFKLGTNSLFKLKRAGCRGIFCLTSVDSVYCCSFNMLGCIKIGLACSETDYIQTVCLHLLKFSVYR